MIRKGKNGYWVMFFGSQYCLKDISKCKRKYTLNNGVVPIWQYKNWLLFKSFKVS